MKQRADNPLDVTLRRERATFHWRIYVGLWRTCGYSLNAELPRILRRGRREALRDALRIGVVRRCSCRRLVWLRNIRWVSPEYVGGGCFWGDCPACGSTLMVQADCRRWAYKQLARALAAVAGHSPLITELPAATARLRARYVRVLTMRYGLNGDGRYTFAQIARALGVSRQRAHQLHGQALRALAATLQAAGE